MSIFQFYDTAKTDYFASVISCIWKGHLSKSGYMLTEVR